MEDKTLYNRLDIKFNATENEIKESYLKSSNRIYPNKLIDEADDNKFKQIDEAYNILMDRDLRYMYDQHGLEGVKNIIKKRYENCKIMENIFLNYDF